MINYTSKETENIDKKKSVSKQGLPLSENRWILFSSWICFLLFSSAC